MDTAKLNGHKHAVIYCRVSNKMSKPIKAIRLNRNWRHAKLMLVEHDFSVVGEFR